MRILTILSSTSCCTEYSGRQTRPPWNWDEALARLLWQLLSHLCGVLEDVAELRHRQVSSLHLLAQLLHVQEGLGQT